MELFQLLGTIAIENGEANEAINETTGNAEQAEKTFGSSIAKMGEKATALGQKLLPMSAGITAAGVAVVAMGTKSAATADNIDKMSQKIGISREAYQELDFICSQSGMSVDTLQMGLKTLTAAMDGAASGTKSNVEQFEKLGVAVTDSDGQLRSQEDVMWDTLNALQGVENQTEKARLATQLFGKSGSELMPLLNGATGSIDEMKQMASDLGLVLDDGAINAGVEYTDAMDQMQRSISAATTSIGAALLPIATKLVDFITANVVPAIHNLANGIGTIANWFDSLPAPVQATIGALLGILAAAGPVLLGIGKIISIGTQMATTIKTITTVFKAFNLTLLANPITWVIAGIVALIAIGVLLVKNWDKVKEAAGKLKENVAEKWEGLKSATAEKFGAIKGKIADSISSAKEKVASKAAEMKAAWQSNLSSMSSTAKGKFEEMKSSISGKMESVKAVVKKGVQKLKDFFNFKWSLPKIKLPHFSMTGKFSLNPPSIPKIGVEWYKQGGILTKPTAFGLNPFSGKAMVGGEAGAEAIAPIDTLKTYIKEAITETPQKIEHTGTIHVEGVNDEGDLVAMVDVAMAEFMRQWKREVRMT